MFLAPFSNSVLSKNLTAHCKISVFTTLVTSSYIHNQDLLLMDVCFSQGIVFFTEDLGLFHLFVKCDFRVLLCMYSSVVPNVTS